MAIKNNIFIICTVRNASDEYRQQLEKYVVALETNGHNVHLPHRDTNQNQKGLYICRQNRQAILNADEIHIFYNPDSRGTHFDMGMAFALNKKIVIVNNIQFGKGKSFAKMLNEWELSQGD